MKIKIKKIMASITLAAKYLHIYVLNLCVSLPFDDLNKKIVAGGKE
jgi:hypothetical protein